MLYLLLGVILLLVLAHSGGKASIIFAWIILAPIIWIGLSFIGFIAAVWIIAGLFLL